MSINDYFQKIFGNNNEQKVNMKIFTQMVETNNYSSLIQITLALSKLILGQKYTVSIPNLFKLSSQHLNNNNQNLQINTFAIDKLQQNEIIQFLNCLLMLKEKLKNTIYQYKIKAIIQTTIKKIPINYKQNVFISSLNQLDKDKSYLKNINIQNQDKIDNLLSISFINGKFSTPLSLYDFIKYQIFPKIQKYILTISNYAQRYQLIKQCLQFLNKVIHQIQLQIRISKNTLVQSRIYNAKVETQMLLRQQNIIDKIVLIINQAILCPSNMSIQILLFRVLRRMYYLWGGRIKYPLFLTIKNISLYSKTQQDQKQVSMFIYKIIKDKSDLQLSNLLDTTQQLHYLKQNSYFSSKAYTFCSQISIIYDTNNLQLPFWNYLVKINSQQMFSYSIVVEKSSSLICWQFYVLNYDIRFGIYKVQNSKDYTIQNYQKQNKCKQIMKFQKLSGTNKDPIKGFVFLKNGYYHIVFDNSYSLIRSKEIIYMMAHLQPQT